MAGENSGTENNDFLGLSTVRSTKKKITSYLDHAVEAYFFAPMFITGVAHCKKRLATSRLGT